MYCKKEEKANDQFLCFVVIITSLILIVTITITCCNEQRKAITSLHQRIYTSEKKSDWPDGQITNFYKTLKAKLKRVEAAFQAGNIQ